MRLRPGRHGVSRLVRWLAAALSVAATFAQLFELSHEAAVRHFRCAEHGELTHVAALSGDVGPNLGPRQTTDALLTQAGWTMNAHEHCASAFTREGAPAPSPVRDPGRAVPPSPSSAQGPVPAPPPARAFLLSSAPKTSPPLA
jgi:hypothetical protein